MSESALHDRLRPERQADSHSRRYRESGFGSRFNAGSDQGPGKGFMTAMVPHLRFPRVKALFGRA